jgi:hypothetical protein
MSVPAAGGDRRADTGRVIGAGFGTTLAEARDGNEAAFGRLFRDLQPAVLRYLQVLAPQAQADGLRPASEPRRA